MQVLKMKKRHQSQYPKVGNHSSSVGSSDVIPIPKTHNIISPSSELQLADMDLRAKCDDIRMNERLVAGMLEKIQQEYFANGVVHPMSEKSLRSIVRKSQTRYEELDGLEQYQVKQDYDTSWDVTFIEDGEEDNLDMMCWSLLGLSGMPSKSTVSNSSMATRESIMIQEAEGEDNENDDQDFVFCLEL